MYSTSGKIAKVFYAYRKQENESKENIFFSSKQYWHYENVVCFKLTTSLSPR